VLLLLLVTTPARPLRAGAEPIPNTDWPNVNGDKGGTRYSPLTQIHRGNVGRLRVAWTYHTGDGAAGSSGSTIECTPVVAEGMLFVTSCSPRPKVIALDAATGRERWKFDPYGDESSEPRKVYPNASGGVNRGVAFWSDGRPGGARRVLHGTTDGRLLALNARTGRPDPAFGTKGMVDLRAGMDGDLSRLPYGVTSAPGVFDNLVILGFSVGEGPGPTAPGDIRAFDVRTGKEAWRFHTVPRPGEFGSETWRESSWKERGGANAWAGMSIDARRGIVFAGLGAPAFDFYGGDRKGRNLFANCVLALDARTGKRLWHFQTVRHDLWDYDNPCPPVVVSIRQNGGKPREAVAQVTKTGFVFLLDRRTGAPLFPVEERAVPASDVPGEEASPTQVFPLKPPPLSRQAFGRATFPTCPRGPATRSKHPRQPSLRPDLHAALAARHGRLPRLPRRRNWSGASFDPTTACSTSTRTTCPG
jgi:quinoprotein glucose dehydrogenase